MRGRNGLLVGLGSYLVNATGGCNDCHTHPSFAPGGDPFQGETEIINTAQFLAGGRQFGSKNSNTCCALEWTTAKSCKSCRGMCTAR